MAQCSIKKYDRINQQKKKYSDVDNLTIKKQAIHTEISAIE
jgi:hypothetical protein